MGGGDIIADLHRKQRAKMWKGGYESWIQNYQNCIYQFDNKENVLSESLKVVHWALGLSGAKFEIPALDEYTI